MAESQRVLKRNKIKSELKLHWSMSDRKIARLCKCSPTTVGKYRKTMKPPPNSVQNGQSGEYQWQEHPFIKNNFELFNAMDKRDKRAIKKPGVIDAMLENGWLSPSYAERYLKQKAEAELLESVNLTKSDIVLEQSDIRGKFEFIESDSVDLVLTDPPYSGDYTYEYEHLVKVASRVLKPDGSLLILTGQSALPYIFNAMLRIPRNMSYHWTLCVSTPNNYNSLPALKLTPQWKPVIHMKKGKYKGKHYRDVISVPALPRGYEKLHEWEQPVELFDRLLEMFGSPGMTVFDPFCGAGTSGVAAIKASCRYIGCDAVKKNIRISKKRIFSALEELAAGSEPSS